MRATQNFADLMYHDANHWTSPWDLAWLTRAQHQKKALIKLYKNVPTSWVCRVNYRISIIVWNSTFGKSYAQQHKSLNISMWHCPIDTRLVPKESPHCALWSYTNLIGILSKPQDQYCCMEFKILQMSCAAIQIIKYLHDHVPNWDGCNTKGQPPSVSTKQCHHYEAAMPTQGSPLMHAPKNLYAATHILEYLSETWPDWDIFSTKGKPLSSSTRYSSFTPCPPVLGNPMALCNRLPISCTSTDFHCQQATTTVSQRLGMLYWAYFTRRIRWYHPLCRTTFSCGAAGNNMSKLWNWDTVTGYNLHLCYTTTNIRQPQEIVYRAYLTRWIRSYHPFCHTTCSCGAAGKNMPKWPNWDGHAWYNLHFWYTTSTVWQLQAIVYWASLTRWISSYHPFCHEICCCGATGNNVPKLRNWDTLSRYNLHLWYTTTSVRQPQAIMYRA